MHTRQIVPWKALFPIEELEKSVLGKKRLSYGK